MPPKISDCETVLKKQAAAIRAAIATLNSAVKKSGKDIVADDAIVKKAADQYREACKAAGYHYELMKQWFEKGKNAAVNDLEKAGADWAKALRNLPTTTDNQMLKQLADVKRPPEAWAR